MKRFVSALTCAAGARRLARGRDRSPRVAATSRAVVVIDTGNGSRRAVISFNGTISGVEALQLAGREPGAVRLLWARRRGVCARRRGSRGGRLVPRHSERPALLGVFSGDRWRWWLDLFRWRRGLDEVGDGDVVGWRFGTGQRPPFSSFCDVAGCAPPPTASPPPAGANGSSAGSAGGAPGANAAPNGPATAAVPGAPAPAAAAPEAVSDPVVTTQPESVVTTTETTDLANSRRGQALGARVPGIPTTGPDRRGA